MLVIVRLLRRVSLNVLPLFIDEFLYNHPGIYGYRGTPHFKRNKKLPYGSFFSYVLCIGWQIHGCPVFVYPIAMPSMLRFSCNCSVFSAKICPNPFCLPVCLPFCLFLDVKSRRGVINATDETLKIPSYPYAAAPSLDVYSFCFNLYIVRFPRILYKIYQFCVSIFSVPDLVDPIPLPGIFLFRIGSHRKILILADGL